MITLLIMTNGRYEYLARALETVEKLHGNFTRILVNDDSQSKLGFTGAMINAWERLKEDSNEWVFHLEEDFIIKQDINLEAMIETMNNHPRLQQLVLLREGIVEKHPERYEDKGNRLEHRVGWSCNPCLYRKSLIYENPWPNVKNSERAYGQTLLRDQNAQFAYWEKYPTVKHIGDLRTGFGY